jgi:splicing factor 3A subunit 2
MSTRSQQVLLSTLRGNTATADIAPTSSPDVVLETLLEAARNRDGGTKSKRHHNGASLLSRKKACRCPCRIQIWHQGKQVKPAAISKLLETRRGDYPLYLSFRVPILGGIDRQNRVGSKFGGGGVSSSQQSERERKERLKQLALESIDLAKDPYLMRNHLGTYECKLCLTLHTNEANYLAHTQGKKHQQGLARRAHMEKLRAEKEGTALPTGPTTGSTDNSIPTRKIRIGRPAYQVFKSRDADTNQRCLSFELSYPEIEVDLQPRHRFMSAFEQRVESPPDRRYQYLLFAADPYETVAFKIPNEPLDKEPGRFVTHWNADEKKFTVTLYFVEPDGKTD